MRTRRSWLAAGLVVLIGGALVCLRSVRRSGPEGAILGGARSDGTAEPEPGDAPPMTVPPQRSAIVSGAAPIEQADPGVTVRSTLRLPLERVEIELAGGSWRAVELVAGALEVPQSARPARLRAPGHMAATITAGTQAVELEPHTSLVIRSFPVSRAKTCDPFGDWPDQREAGQAFVVAGACDASTWAIAFDAPQLREVVPDMGVRFDLDDGTGANLTHDLESGRHDVYVWPRMPLDVRTELVAVEVERRRPGAGPLEARIWAYPDSIEAAIGKKSLWSEKTPWGSISAADYLERFEGLFDVPGFELGPLVLGKRYGLAVRDVESGDHARIFFVHDGSTRRLELQGGVRVHGVLDAAPALPPPRFERIVWEFTDGRPGHQYWSAETLHVPVATDGGFELVLPAEIPISARSSPARPDALELTLRASAFENVSRRFDTAGLREVDLGVVRIERHATQLVLAGEHGLAAEDLDWQSLEVAEHGETVYFSIAGAAPNADGSLAVALIPHERGGFEADGPHGDSPHAWPAPPELVLVQSDAGIPFRMTPAGSYQREPTREYSLRIEANGAQVPKSARELIVGWRWEGIDHRARGWRIEALQAPRSTTFVAPAHGAQLWWRLDSGPDDAGSLPLDSSELTLRVP